MSECVPHRLKCAPRVQDQGDLPSSVINLIPEFHITVGCYCMQVSRQPVLTVHRDSSIAVESSLVWDKMWRNVAGLGRDLAAHLLVCPLKAFVPSGYNVVPRKQSSRRIVASWGREWSKRCGFETRSSESSRVWDKTL